MAPLDEDVQAELNSATGGFYSPGKSIEVNGSENILVTRYAKHMDTKYPIKDKSGNSLGFTWRFWLSDGRVWDVSNRNRKVLMQGLHPGGNDVVVPARFRVTNLGRSVNKAPAISVEFLESVPA